METRLPEPSVRFHVGGWEGSFCGRMIFDHEAHASVYTFRVGKSGEPCVIARLTAFRPCLPLISGFSSLTCSFRNSKPFSRRHESFRLVHEFARRLSFTPKGLGPAKREAVSGTTSSGRREDALLIVCHGFGGFGLSTSSAVQFLPNSKHVKAPGRFVSPEACYPFPRVLSLA